MFIQCFEKNLSQGLGMDDDHFSRCGSDLEEEGKYVQQKFSQA